MAKRPTHAKFGKGLFIPQDPSKIKGSFALHALTFSHNSEVEKTKKKMPSGRMSNRKPPVSAFAGGKFKSSLSGLTGKKDSRNLVIVEGLQQGIVVAHVRKCNKDEEAFIAPHVRFLENNMDFMEQLGINAIVARRGSDGKTPMMNRPGSDYHWRQFLMVVGEEGNTKEERLRLAKDLVKFLNDVTKVDYKFVTKNKFSKDVTSSNLRAIDACLLDADVIGLMNAAYPSLTLDQMAEQDSIMSGFWDDISRGKEVIEAEWEDDNDEEEEEEEED